MKTQNIFLLLIAGVILYEYQKQKSGDIQWISCDDPRADPVMCRLIQEQRNQLLLEAMVP